MNFFSRFLNELTGGDDWGLVNFVEVYFKLEAMLPQYCIVVVEFLVTFITVHNCKIDAAAMHIHCCSIACCETFCYAKVLNRCIRNFWFISFQLYKYESVV